MAYPESAVDVFNRNFKEKMLSGPYKDNWQYQRERAITRDDSECVECGMNRQAHKQKYDSDIHVHHINPRENYSDDERPHVLSNLMTLCASCHREIEVADKDADPNA